MIRGMIRNMKIRKKLVISYLLACVIPLVITCLTIYHVSAKNLEETSLELASVFSSQIVTNIDTFIEEYSRVTKTVLIDNDIIYGLDENMDASVTERVDQQLNLRKIMMRLVTLKPEIRNICFLTAEQQFYQFNTEGSSIDKAVLLEQEWLEPVLASSDQMIVTAAHDRAYCDREQDGIVLTVGRKILDNRGAYVGVILIDLDPNTLIELNEGFLLARNQYNIKISITDVSGGILYDSDVASGGITWEEARSGAPGGPDQKNIHDFILLSSQTKRSGLSVNVLIPRSTLLFKINKIGYVTAFAIITCILVVILISSVLSRMITKPIATLQEGMKQVEEGEYRQLLRKESDDEIGSLVSSYNRMVLQIKALIEDVYMAEIKQKNARYLALKTQINPHMLFNTLESIRMKALVTGADEVADMIKILARMFKLTLNDRDALHKIQNEIEYAENYMKLQNMRFPDSFFLQIDLDNRIREAYIISMVLQPIVENAIEHGYKGYGNPLHIRITGEIAANEDIQIRIRDDGKGMPREHMDRINDVLEQAERTKLKPQEERPNKGIGLKNIAERIKLYYGEEYYLKVVDGTACTAIEICIPAQWQEQR